MILLNKIFITFQYNIEKKLNTEDEMSEDEDEGFGGGGAKKEEDDDPAARKFQYSNEVKSSRDILKQICNRGCFCIVSAGFLV